MRDVDEVWTEEWSRAPVVILPRNQQDMATLIGSDGKGLAQIAAVTTGSFESGLSRGDRIVINPAAWDTLGDLGRRVVITHEMTHVATRVVERADRCPSGCPRASPTTSPTGPPRCRPRSSPATSSTTCATVTCRSGCPTTPTSTPRAATSPASYEGAWLACRMIAERYGEKRLVRFYRAMSDSDGPGLAARARGRARHDAAGAGARLEGLPARQGGGVSPATPPEPAPTAPRRTPPLYGRPRPSALRRLVDLFVLCGFVVAQPVLDAFGRAGETIVFRQRRPGRSGVLRCRRRPRPAARAVGPGVARRRGQRLGGRRGARTYSPGRCGSSSASRCSAGSTSLGTVGVLVGGVLLGVGGGRLLDPLEGVPALGPVRDAGARWCSR